jgi:HTH-type transcriptional regulator/antitoxin HigA
MTDGMIAKREWSPNWAIHPGVLLQEHLESRDLSQAEFARVAGLTPKLVSTIIKGSNPVTAETAIRLERVLGLKAYIWTGIQSRWDLFQARKVDGTPDTRKWLSLFPIAELKQRNWLTQTNNEKELVDSLLHLFQIGTPEAYSAKVRAFAAHHRRSKRHATSEHNVFTWLMLGGCTARQSNMSTFDSRKFNDALQKIRNFTTGNPNAFIAEMKILCCDAGVALVLERPMSKTFLCGSALWIDPYRALIQISPAIKSNDQFWWTFFHEAAHIVLHRGRNFIDDQNGVGDEVEEEADSWAEDILVGRDRFAQFKATQPRSGREIIAFADRVGVHAGIIVGMLQHSHVLPPRHLNHLKLKFEISSETLRQPHAPNP